MLVDRYHLFGMLYQVASTKTYISQPLPGVILSGLAVRLVDEVILGNPLATRREFSFCRPKDLFNGG